MKRFSAFLFILLLVPSAGADEPIKATVGEHKVVFPAGYRDLNYFPDEPISILSKKPFRFLLVAGNSTILMQGQSLESASPVGKVFGPGDKSAFDNGYAGITSAYLDKRTKKLFGFYHAEDHVGMPKVSYNTDIQGAYWSIGLAMSKDGGNTFVKGGQILTSSVSKKDVTKDHQGIGDVCVIADATNTYFFAYYTDLSRLKDDEKARIGMARCRISDEAKPGSWFKYHGGEFKEKGLGGKQSAVANPPAAFQSEVGAPHVTYLPEWKKYIMVCNVGAYADFEKKKAEKGGIFFCYSDDGIKWSEPQVLVVGLPVPYQDKEYVAHPSIDFVNVKPNKAEGWLLYSYSPRWGLPADKRVPHHLARRHITFELNASKATDTLKNRLMGTKWTNSNKVSFEWTTDGRFLHKGVEREWKVLDEKRVQITFGQDHSDTLVFNEAFTEFEQLVKGGPTTFKGKKDIFCRRILHK